MARVLTGIQSSGKPHLGNLLGAILPALDHSAKQSLEAAFFFIADLHALTTVKDGKLMAEYTRQVAASWLACGLDTEKDVFYRQSRVHEVCRLAWILNCFTPFPMLANAHSFKDKSENLAEVNAGLFTYPVLMAADILLYDTHLVPVGKDQKQHLEIARDIASAFNRLYPDTFVLPEAAIREEVMTVPGTDGRKMSKSYNNYINVFLPEKELKKVIMGIKTDSTPLEEPKNPDTCTVFTLFALLASDEEKESLRNEYLKGGMGYGHAKTKLLELILSRFAKERKRYDRFISDENLLEQTLLTGEARARKIAQTTIQRVESLLGIGS